jgi:hypothetical protein
MNRGWMGGGEIEDGLGDGCRTAGGWMEDGWAEDGWLEDELMIDEWRRDEWMKN